MVSRRRVLGMLPAICGLFLCGCMDRSSPAEQTMTATDSVHVAAAWSWDTRGATSYARGMELALEEINAAGGVLGKPLSIHRVEDGESLQTGRMAAKSITSDGRYAAVIGHLHSDISLAAAAIYADADVLMISPASTSPRLTDRGLPLVFRTANSDETTAAQMAIYAEEQGYHRVALCYVRSDYGAGLANALERYAGIRGITVLDRISYEASGQAMGFLELRFADWAQLDLDAIILAGTAPSAAGVARAIRAVGLSQPILGGDGLDDQTFIQRAGSAAEGVAAVSVFHPDHPRQSVLEFRSIYETAYGVPPDSWAARGYEVVRLLADAIEHAGSTNPNAIATALRSRRWRTLSDSISFDDRGDPVARPGLLLRILDGSYHYERELQIPSTGRVSSPHEDRDEKTADAPRQVVPASTSSETA